MRDSKFAATSLATCLALDQDEVWIDVEGVEWAIEDMDPVHRRNCINYLRERAGIIELHYSYGELVRMGPGPTAPHASDAFDAEIDRIIDDGLHRSKDPVAWLDSTPLMQALIAAQNAWESDGNFADG